MCWKTYRTIFVPLVLLAAGEGWGVAIGQEADGVQPGVEVVMRGPVHEAFAELPSPTGEPAVTVAVAPPADIAEESPAERPAQHGLEWIPGYWAWEAGGERHLWISGIWRRPPPGRVWVPGYWTESLEGFRRVAGYWTDANSPDVYLPAPPEPQVDTPAEASPGVEFTWLHGHWVMQQGEYVWRSGQWAKATPGYVIVPAHYVWTERGYVYVSGYRDYLLTRRGVLFAPVALDVAALGNDFVWTPTVVIDSYLLPKQLFCHPDQNTYCFGDYFDPRYADAGVRPWFEHYAYSHGNEPLFAHYRWWSGLRGERDWTDRVAGSFNRLRDDVNSRPPLRYVIRSGSSLSVSGRATTWSAPYREWLDNSRDQQRRRAIEQAVPRNRHSGLTAEEKAERRRAVAVQAQQAAESRENARLNPPFDEKTQEMRRGGGAGALSPPFDRKEPLPAPRRSTPRPVADESPQSKGETPRDAGDDDGGTPAARKSKVAPNAPSSNGPTAKSPYTERRERKLIPQGTATKTKASRPRGVSPTESEADDSPYAERREKKLIPQGTSSTAPTKPGQRGPSRTADAPAEPQRGLNPQPAPSPKVAEPPRQPAPSKP